MTTPSATGIPSDASLRFDNTFGQLPEAFYARVAPTPVKAPRILRVNAALAEELGLDPAFLASAEGAAILAGNRVPESAEPIAMAYAGHQFGSFVPSLGDGRAVLLGEVVGRDGLRRDLQLKGAGRTPFSRGGDGRAGIGPVLREYILSEAMAGLGVPTTRALAMVTTGETIERDEGAVPGAILARVARTHIRVGTFEYHACRSDQEAVRTLADYAIERLYPEIPATRADAPFARYRQLLDAVIRGQADLIAAWMGIGFIHGVMNTDNVSIAAETIDYGPCAFLDAYEPSKAYSSIDRRGRYAFDQQPRIGHWNLVRFAETLLPLLGATEEEAVEVAKAALNAYPPRYEASHRAGLQRKLGLQEALEGDAELAGDLLAAMAEHDADFTLTFRRLSDLSTDREPGDLTTHPALPFAHTTDFEAWRQRWRARLSSEGRDAAALRASMRAVNPAYIPRNHRVQQAIDAATWERDLQPLDDLLAVVTTPYEDHPDRTDYQKPPKAHEVVQRTFCGT